MTEDFQAGRHPFGRDITRDDLLRRFAECRQWEDRLRQVIALAKALPPLPEALKTDKTALSGCENRVWLGYQPETDGTLHFFADSDGRIVKGLLAVILTGVEGKTPAQLKAQDPLGLFDDLGLREELSVSRAAGLNAIAERIRAIALRQWGN
ncbi:cysteine desulfurase sulfur acceptor subunit CsdE [Martelella alba]|uniref:Cysteine desulfurase sulfur acceptor subunit CsdE n=1 Tax=Martelella alba TaxID=2590451 RepID=A0ABY2SK62_9HYPH|nr:cysteine desulfurase sulfur acceptor subunit CsdE [Martelella alba]TKI05919.1 cysteine desulfurase sulfur acceptor subunit CsdE [Martelella alba]